MLSVPLLLADTSAADIYPGAESPAFIYSGRYIVSPGLSAGKGFWMKYGHDTTVSLTGNILSSLSIDVKQGWNMIGSLSMPLPVVAVTTVPASLVSSHFFGYDRAYQNADTLQPGRGYWVKVSQAGTLQLGGNAALASARINMVMNAEMPPDPPGVFVDKNAGIPGDVALLEPFPNPFNPATDVSFLIPHPAQVTIRVYDILGQELSVLVNSVFEEGKYTIRWDAAGLAGGMYFIRMTAAAAVGAGEPYTAIKKVVLVR